MGTETPPNGYSTENSEEPILGFKFEELVTKNRGRGRTLG
jgi:hypothetical protein